MVPPSLKNIYKEIQNEYPSFVPPKHGDLSELAKQGVLLLNTALTVRANQVSSSSKNYPHRVGAKRTRSQAVFSPLDCRLHPTRKQAGSPLHDPSSPTSLPAPRHPHLLPHLPPMARFSCAGASTAKMSAKQLASIPFVSLPLCLFRLTPSSPFVMYGRQSADLIPVLLLDPSCLLALSCF
jgi:hypothetical protein